MVTRVFVEKKQGFNIEAQQMLADLKGNLGLRGLEEVRILNRYDVSGLSEEQFGAAARTILSEPTMDAVYGEDFRLPGEYQVFAMEYLPGQYDQRADSAAQCVQLLTQGERPAVATAKVIGLKGQVSAEEFEKVKHYLINPVESREASMEKPATLEMQADVPADVARVTGFTTWDKAQMQAYFDSMGFAMTLSDLEFCRDYFRDEEHRDPTVTELRVIDTYWSDHCRHTTFLTRLNKIDVEKGALSQAVEKALRDYLALREEPRAHFIANEQQRQRGQHGCGCAAGDLQPAGSQHGGERHEHNEPRRPCAKEQHAARKRRGPLRQPIEKQQQIFRYAGQEHSCRKPHHAHQQHRHAGIHGVYAQRNGQQIEQKAV